MATLTLPQALGRAASAYQAGAVAEAESLCRQIVAADPNFFLAQFLLGAAQARLGKYDLALASYDRALALQADHAEALYNRGNTLKALSRFEDAIASYDRALAAKPDYAEALNNRGVAQQALGRLDQALASHQRAVALRPAYAEAIRNAALLLQTLRRFDDALAAYDRLVALAPNDAAAWNDRGIVLFELRRFAEAQASHEHALALRPDYPEAHNNHGNALKALNRFEDAIASYNRALALRPLYAYALNNRGIAQMELRHVDAALSDYRRAVAARPDFADAHYNEALCCLLSGDLARGWEKSEWRWESSESVGDKRSLAQPMWRGEDIAGKTILLHPEQGLGDTIHFCRYVPMVEARGARVIFEVERPLRALMGTLDSGAEIVAQGDPLPTFDLYCPLLSLPGAFGTRIETVSAAVPYLRAAPNDVSAWAARLAPHRRPRIGLAWSGRAGHKNDHNRSMPLAMLAPLFALDATFIVVQKDIRAVDAPLVAERLLDYGESLGDFTDTAALMQNLDLVISVDTSVAHLAGALARPVWVLLPFTPDWRWLLDRTDSPWYPTARLFRQSTTRRWDPVVRIVRDALADFLRSHSQRIS